MASKSFDTSLFNLDHVYNSPANDGKTYPQLPTFDIREKVSAAYARLDWGTTVADMDLDAAHRSAIALEKFCEGVDIQIAVHVVSGSTVFPGTRIR